MLECRVKEFLKKNKDIYETKSGFVCKRSPYVIKLPNRFSPELCKMLGEIHGDGNLSSNRIHITDKCKEFHIKKLNPEFKKLFGVKLNLYHDKPRNSYYSHLKSSVLYRYFTEVLELPKGAVRENIKISKYMKTWNNEFMGAYMAGLFDAESNISKRQAQISFSTTSIKIFNLVKRFLNKIKVKYSIYIRSRRKNKEYEIYIYGKKNIKHFLKYVKISHPDKKRLLCKFIYSH